MPSGIIMQSASHGATQEDIEKVFEKNGLEFDKPEPEAPVEPKREDFKSDAEFEAARTEFDAKQEEAEAEAAAKEEEEEERKRKEQETRHPRMSRRQKAVDAATKELREKNKQLEERLAALESKKEPVKPAPELKTPKREDFKSDEEFEEAKFDYRYKLRRAKEQEEQNRAAIAEAQKDLEKHQKEVLEQYQASKEEIKQEYDDWEEVMEEFGSAQVSQTVYMTILSVLLPLQAPRRTQETERAIPRRRDEGSRSPA
jgi:DNA repair exonuclease SbcCD ATPase subunit